MRKVFLAFAFVLAGSLVQAQHKHEIKIPADVEQLLSKYTCLACHKADQRLVGPAYLDVSKKKYTNAQVIELIYNPKPANGPGYPPMAPMKQVPKDAALKIAAWINSIAKKHG